MTPTALAATHRAAFTTERPWTSVEFAELLKQRGMYLVGDADSFVLGRVTLDEAEVLTVATLPALRRQGRARAALAAFTAQAKEAGAVSVFLEVASDNLDAIALYRSAGFAKVGARRAYYARDVATAADAIVMRCMLTLG